ncbi:hypothetical protein C0J52_27459 [Blattella germanica]|nr:hypothetical protein C0J52_27459 [Blattella germanica]
MANKLRFSDKEIESILLESGNEDSDNSSNSYDRLGTTVIGQQYMSVLSVWWRYIFQTVLGLSNH